MCLLVLRLPLCLCLSSFDADRRPVVACLFVLDSCHTGLFYRRANPPLFYSCQRYRRLALTVVDFAVCGLLYLSMSLMPTFFVYAGWFFTVLFLVLFASELDAQQRVRGHACVPVYERTFPLHFFTETYRATKHFQTSPSCRMRILWNWPCHPPVALLILVRFCRDTRDGRKNNGADKMETREKMSFKPRMN